MNKYYSLKQKFPGEKSLLFKEMTPSEEFAIENIGK